WVCLVFFFFSSRRRHTRSKRDWSSDVCSSDLGNDIPRRAMTEYHVLKDLAIIFAVSLLVILVFHRIKLPALPGFIVAGVLLGPKIGRASCRERVEISGGAVALQKKQRVITIDA